MTEQDPPEDGPTQPSEFEAFRESMVFEGPELTFTPRGSPDPRLMRLVPLLAQQAARECYEEELRLAREKKARSSPPAERRAKAIRSLRNATARCRGH